MSRPRRIKFSWLKVALVIWLILIAVGLFGCGGGGDEEEAPQTEEQRTAARITNQDRGDRQ